MFYLYPTAQNNKLKSHVLYTISPFCLSPKPAKKGTTNTHTKCLQTMECNEKNCYERNDRLSNHKFIYAHIIP